MDKYPPTIGDMALVSFALGVPVLGPLAVLHVTRNKPHWAPNFGPRRGPELRQLARAQLKRPRFAAEGMVGGALAGCYVAVYGSVRLMAEVLPRS